MQNIIKLVINDNDVLEYDKSIELPNTQSQYLEHMDNKMAAGFTLAEKFIDAPEQLQKAQFVALNMLALLDQGEEQQAIAMFTYLVNALSELKQVKVKGKEGKYKVEFVFYKDLSDWESVQFH